MRSMANKKNHYYVIVMTGEGAKFVTATHYHDAEWDGEKAPKEFTREMATDIVCGLNWNGYLAYIVVMPIEITNQPYNYNAGRFEWIAGKRES